MNGNNIIPFIISLIGVLTDYITTRVGLRLGFYETYPQYHPILALVIFWGALTMLTLSLPRKKSWWISKNVLAAASLLGSVNNTLVIFGIFPGLVVKG